MVAGNMNYFPSLSQEQHIYKQNLIYGEVSNRKDNG